MLVQNGFAQEVHIPYPIIFVHGLTDSDKTWNELVHFMVNSSGLSYGDKMDFCLNIDVLTSDTTTDYKDYTNFNNLSKGDLYTINFDVDEFGTPYSNSKIIQSNQSAVVKQGLAISKAIKHVLEKTGKDKVILVGHSMGGLASREYLQNKNLWYEPNKKHHVAKLATIGTPHGGCNLSATNILFIVGLIDIDLSSEAVRDLRTSYQNRGEKGIYLFGGKENFYYKNYFSLGQEYFQNGNVNCNGTNGDAITGLNNKYYPTDLAYSCCIGTGSILGADGNVFETGDGVVSEYSANINNFLKVNAEVFPLSNPFSLIWHKELTKQLSEIIKIIDEPEDPELSYTIDEKSITKGFISMREDNSPVDIDLYKINLKDDGELSVTVNASNYTGITKVTLIDQNEIPIKPITVISETINYHTSAGVYYLKISGLATDDNPDKPASYYFPYTIKTDFVASLQTLITTSPTKSLTFYDVIINSSKEKPIKLTNNGVTNILITKLTFSGDNADQYSISPMPPFLINAGESVNFYVKFSPTSIGEKVAKLEINNNTSDLPTNIISLIGNGVDHETKILIFNNTTAYNYGNTKINSSKSKTFTIQNTGSNTCTISNLALEGTNPDSYSITSPSNTSFDIGSGETRQITIKFSPTSIGVKDVALVITNNSDNLSPKDTIELYGNGIENYYSGSNNSIIAYEYWFDDQYDSKVNVSVSPLRDSYLNELITTDTLKCGLHLFHIRSLDRKGKWSAISSEFFNKMPVTSAGTREITACEYWIDDNYANKVATQVEANQSISIENSIELDSLQNGLHTYHVRYRDDAGQWSTVVSEFFNKMPVTNAGTREITACEYWIDDNYTNKVATPVEANQTISIENSIDLDSLQLGLHTYHVRYRDDAGLWSTVVSEFFNKMPITKTGTREITACEYWIDDNYAKKVFTPVEANQTISINNGIDLDSLQLGLHTYNVRYRDDAGLWSAIVSEFFQKSPVSSSQINLITSYRFWFDRNEENIQNITLSEPINPYQLNTSLNTLNLPNGLHTIHFQFMDTNRMWSSVTTDSLTKFESFSQDIALNAGWNIFSANLIPANLNLKELLQPLIDVGKLNKVLDESDRSIEYLEDGWKNNIGNIEVSKGYKVNLSESDTLLLEGTIIQLPMDINLVAGWNYISYPCALNQDAMLLVKPLINGNKLIKFMDEKGNSIEDFGIYGGWKNNIGNLIPGKGYKVYVKEPCILSINSSTLNIKSTIPSFMPTVYFKKVFEGNGNDHMNIHMVDLNELNYHVGDEIGVFDGEYCVGSAMIDSAQLSAGSLSIASSSNDDFGETINGFNTGHQIELYLYRDEQTSKLKIDKISGSETFEKNGSIFVKAISGEPTEILNKIIETQFKCFPNPFTEAINIEIQNANAKNITVDIFNIVGQKIKSIYNGTRNGNIVLKWDGTNTFDERVDPGMYLCKVNGQVKKIIYRGWGNRN